MVLHWTKHMSIEQCIIVQSNLRLPSDSNQGDHTKKMLETMYQREFNEAFQISNIQTEEFGQSVEDR